MPCVHCTLRSQQQRAKTWNAGLQKGMMEFKQTKIKAMITKDIVS